MNKIIIYINNMNFEKNDEMNNLVKDFITEVDDKDRQLKQLEEWAENATDEELLAAYKNINPYGVVNVDDELRGDGDDDNIPTASFSYTNYRLEYAREWTATSMIAYLFRNLDEYECPQEIPPVDMDDYIADPTICDTPDRVTDERLTGLYEQYKESMKKKVEVYKFLTHVLITIQIRMYDLLTEHARKILVESYPRLKLLSWHLSVRILFVKKV